MIYSVRNIQEADTGNTLQVVSSHGYCLHFFVSGMMSKKEFMKLAKVFVPRSDRERFASNVFKLFDEDKNGFLDFGGIISCNISSGEELWVGWLMCVTYRTPRIAGRDWSGCLTEFMIRLVLYTVYDNVGCIVTL